MTDSSRGYQQFLAELKRRRVFRVIAVYGIVAFGIIEAADIMAPRMALPDWTVTLVVWVALFGFPVAIFLAWVFDLTPEGVRRTAEAAPGEIEAIVAAPASTRWPAAVFAFVGVTALLAGAWFAGRQSAAEGADLTDGPVAASIAVLPFVNMSSDQEQAYFSDGISEELLNLLARIPELRVAARTSSFSFRDQNLEITEIADRLNVAHVLEGSVRKSGDEVRITVQLIRAEDGFHLWSETWDRTLDDIFAIQDEIAADVVAQLQVTLLGTVPTVEETDPAAYTLLLQARQLGRQNLAKAFEESNALYGQALEIDAQYASAWAGLAKNYALQAGRGLRPHAEGSELAREAAMRTLAIDPEHAGAHAVLGRIAGTYDNDLAAAARHYERALELDPTNLDILQRAARLVRVLDRVDEAVVLLEFVVARDPVNVNGHAGLGLYYLWAGRLEESIATTRTALSLSPRNNWLQYIIGEALLLKGEYEAALQEMQRESAEDWRMIGMPMVYHALGRATESDAALAELIDKYAESRAFNIAYLLAFRGEADRAFEWLDRAVENNEAGLAQISVELMFANIHDDPRWLPFLESIGKSPEQLAAIEFEVRLPQ